MKTIIVFIFHLIAFAGAVSGQVEKATIRLNDTIHLEMYRVPFNAEGKHLEFNNHKYLLSVDHVPLFGTDGEMPDYLLEKAVLFIGKIKYDLQIDNMYNPWLGDSPFEKSFRLKMDGDHIKVQGVFSDGAGSYGAEWIISGRSSIRSIITNDEHIVIGYILNEKM